MKISILMLTHNAPAYVRESVETLQQVTASESLADVELIVWDNASNKETRDLLTELKADKKIDKLYFSDINHFFAKGNNLAAKLADENADCYLLLNSDISIKDSRWLEKLIKYKTEGGYAGVSYGVVRFPPVRCDGYCFLVDKTLYDQYQLDERYEWWGGLTKFQANLLRDGYDLLALGCHDCEIVHYGGKSGAGFQQAKGMDLDYAEIISWFSTSKGKVTFRRHNKLEYCRKILPKLFMRVKNLGSPENPRQ